MGVFGRKSSDSTKPSDIIREKLIANGGSAEVYSLRGEKYIIKAAKDGKSFLCDQLRINPPYRYEVFDIAVDAMKKGGGRARKGGGRNFRLGEGKCTEDTIVGAIGAYYFKKHPGESVYDPVFVLAAVLEWAGIANNMRGYMELTDDYKLRIQKG
jgi:hypothetical protein